MPKPVLRVMDGGEDTARSPVGERKLRARPLGGRIPASKTPRVTPQLRQNRWSGSSIELCQKNPKAFAEAIIPDSSVVSSSRKRPPEQLRASVRLQRLRCFKIHRAIPAQPTQLHSPLISQATAFEDSSEIIAAEKVKNTIRTFKAYFQQAFQEEEICFQKDQQKIPIVKRTKRRSNMEAFAKMIKNNAILFLEKTIGHLPGINVGDQFYSRAEMVVIGLHKNSLDGIDFIARSKENMGFNLHPLAVSIVFYEEYEDDLDNPGDFIYIVEGGNNLTGDQRKKFDKRMTKGNLALKNSIEQGNVVRVIHGHHSSNSYSGKIYTYDGLYRVIEHWVDNGVSGHTFNKYRMRRVEIRESLTTQQVHFFQGDKANCAYDSRGLVCYDISNGLEQIPVLVSNLLDKLPTLPAFRYLTNVEIPKSIKMPAPALGCLCKGKCVNSYKCSCARLNGNSFPYVDKDGGRLVEAKDIVFECGPQCNCASACVNRATQRGLQYRLEVFRTSKKGWGVRSWDKIPSGAFVCEYTGKVVMSDELDAIDDTYVFALDCMLTMRGVDGRERRWGGISKPIQKQLGVTRGEERHDTGQAEYSIDAGDCGNVSRFINHSCDPNLFVQCVLTSHHDVKLARIALFASDDIPPLQELSYDYGYILNSVVDDKGKIKKRRCYCGALICRKRLY